MRRDWLNPGERYGRALCSTECVINLNNRKDPALMLYPLRHLFAGHALGSSGLSSHDRRHLPGWSKKILDYDVSRQIGHGHMWPHYTSRRQLAWLIRNFVYFPDVEPVQLDSTQQPTNESL